MVGTAGRIQAKIIPVAKVAKEEGGHEFCAILCFQRVGAGEACSVELVPSCITQSHPFTIGCNLVIAGFVVIVSQQVRLTDVRT